MGLAQVLPEIPVLKASYVTGHMFRMPVNITVSVSYHCNSGARRATCGCSPTTTSCSTSGTSVRVVGHRAVLVHLQRGRTDARADLPEMVESAYRHCRARDHQHPDQRDPRSVIPGRIEQVLQAAPKAEVIMNLSLDAVGERHDEIRGVANNWSRAMSTYRQLKDLQRDHSNLTVGIHTVISSYNVALVRGAVRLRAP